MPSPINHFTTFTSFKSGCTWIILVQVLFYTAPMVLLAVHQDAIFMLCMAAGIIFLWTIFFLFFLSGTSIKFGNDLIEYKTCYYFQTKIRNISKGDISKIILKQHIDSDSGDLVKNIFVYGKHDKLLFKYIRSSQDFIDILSTWSGIMPCIEQES